MSSPGKRYENNARQMKDNAGVFFLKASLCRHVGIIIKSNLLSSVGPLCATDWLPAEVQRYHTFTDSGYLEVTSRNHHQMYYIISAS